MEKATISFETTITRPEFRKLMSLGMMSKPSMKILVYFYRFILVMAPLNVLLTFIATKTGMVIPGAREQVLRDAIMSFFGMYGLAGAFYALFIFSYDNAYKVQKQFHKPIHFSMNEERVTMSTATIETTATLRELHSITESRDWFLLYLTALSVIPMPKKDLQPAQILEIRQILQRAGIKKTKLMK